ncbi:MAG TPA: hypothetical protein VGQ65_04110 [Thermoanaerobaculia bacterium]|jgi:hypothetical protein|nr:hypothetical protein [Thermoanaerobaculia bacterium]
MATHDQIRAIKDRYGQTLLGSPRVSGVGIERDSESDYKLVVHLADDSARDDLPEELDGEKIHYVRSGPFVKLPADSREK